MLTSLRIALIGVLLLCLLRPMLVLRAAVPHQNVVAVLLDGPGETKAAARYTAHITNLGLGAVAVAGSPKCTVVARAGGPVACGR